VTGGSPISGQTERCARRSAWLCIAIGAAIAACLIIPFRHLRLSKLTPSEGRIVGEWTFRDRIHSAVTHRIRFQPDRTFLVRTSSGTTGSGTWKIVGKELTTSLETQVYEPERSLKGFIRFHFDRLWHSEGWADSIERFELDGITQSSVRMRDAEGAEMIWRRVASQL
jgi:hypothetical protein